MGIKKRIRQFAVYPCNDYLNSALRYLLDAEQTYEIDHAILEIIYCIRYAHGELFEDVEKNLKERGYII